METKNLLNGSAELELQKECMRIAHGYQLGVDGYSMSVDFRKNNQHASLDVWLHFGDMKPKHWCYAVYDTFAQCTFNSDDLDGVDPVESLQSFLKNYLS